MKIYIIEKATSKAIGPWLVRVGGINYEATMQDAYNEAWRCAVEDGEVLDVDRAKYTFQAEDE
jgi:hypothetical protein